MKKSFLALVVAFCWVNLVLAQAPSGVVPAAPAPKPAPAASTPVPTPTPATRPAPTKIRSFTFFDTVEECKAAVAAGKAKVYKPLTVAPFKEQGWERKVVPKGGACLGRAYVIEDGSPVNGKAVFVLEGFVYWQHQSGSYRMDECSNAFEQIAFFLKESQPTIPPVTVVGTTVTTTSTVNIAETRTITERVICVAGDRQVEIEIKDWSGSCPTLEIKAPARIAFPTDVQSSVVHRTMTVAAGSCTNDCITHEEVRVNREEKRADGRCFVQTNLGYRFELRAQAKSGNTMVGLVDPSTNKLIEGAKARYIAADLKAPLLADGKPDCDGMQSQLYKSWEDVRKSYDLPSSCRLQERPQQGTRRQQT